MLTQSVLAMTNLVANFIFDRGWGSWVLFGWLIIMFTVVPALMFLTWFLNKVSGRRKWGDWLESELGIHTWQR